MAAQSLALSIQLPVLSSGSLQAYLDSIQQIPILSQEEEGRLFERFHTEHDLKAARQLILAHLRYVVYVARSYSGYGLPMEDLIQQGNIGLMKSVKRFSLQHRVRLITFAIHWIKAEIHEYILKNWKIVKIATTKAQRKLFFNLRKFKQRLGWFNQAEIEQTAIDLKVKPEDVLEMESRLSQVDTSFDGPILETDEDSTVCPAAYLTQGMLEDPARVAEDEEITDIQANGLRAALTVLDARARDIIESRWLHEPKAGLKVLSEKYGVSMERIRQIETQSFAKIRPYLQT